MDWLINLLQEPGTGTPILIILAATGFPAMAWMVVRLTEVIVRHREHIAKIERGIDPGLRRGELNKSGESFRSA